MRTGSQKSLESTESSLVSVSFTTVKLIAPRGESVLPKLYTEANAIDQVRLR